MEWRYERMGPADLEAARAACPVVFLPLGALEYHGRHLPVGLDGLKAHALCGRAVEALGGGVVLPALYFGTGGGHAAFEWSIMQDEALIGSLLRRALKRLADNGYRVAVVLTGHYPEEQVRLIKRIADEVMAARPDYTVLALCEPEADPERDCRDHAAQWETSIMMALFPQLVRLERLRADTANAPLPPSQYAAQDPAVVGVCVDAHDPLYGIFGRDPLAHASAKLGEAVVAAVTANLVQRVRAALRGH